MALSVYFDASVIVALLVRDDAFNARAEAFIRDRKPIPIVSDFAGVEFASAIARRVRMKDLTAAEARAAFRAFDSWKEAVAAPAQIAPPDLASAEAALRRTNLSLRTADAIHIALAKRLGAALATFDGKMAASARSLGLPVATK